MSTRKRRVKKVLIVSSDDKLSLLLEFLLRADGFQVVISKTTDLAIQSLLLDRPQAILFDLQSQQDNWSLNPIEFIQHTWPKISIFTVVRPEHTGLAKQSLRRGAQGFLITPVDYRGVKALLGGSAWAPAASGIKASLYQTRSSSTAIN